MPGGGLEWGETMEDCALRELKEETNMNIKISKLLYVFDLVSRESQMHFTNIIFLGYITNSDNPLKVIKDKRILEAKYIPIEKISAFEIYPPIGKYLIQSFEKKFQEPAIFLGNLHHLL